MTVLKRTHSLDDRLAYRFGGSNLTVNHTESIIHSALHVEVEA
jgi:hypothetical protein